MNKLWIYIGIILVCEALAALVFYLLARWNSSDGTKSARLSWRGLFKGWVERAFLVYAFLRGFPQALTFFAALKIATRIKDENHISNDFYLIGNIISVSLAILYSQLLSEYFG